MMKLIFFIFLLLFIIDAQAQEVSGVYKRYAGTINKKLPVTVDLLIEDSVVDGHYYYNTIGEQIMIQGKKNKEEVSWEELVDTLVTGQFTGKINSDLSEIEGTWTDRSKTKSFKVKLASFLPEGSVELNTFRKSYNYEWQKNTDGESLGCTAAFGYCYVVNMTDKSTEQKMNELLIDAGLAGDETPEDLKNVAERTMDDEFSSYVDAYHDAFPDSIIAENRKYMDESPYIYNWENEETRTPIYDENYVLCLEGFTYTFTGGAHGNYGFTYQSFDLRTGEVLQLDDVMRPNSRASLTGIVEQQLRKDFHIDSKTPLSEAGFFVDKLELNDNFFIGHNGMGFLYNPYEIASYADGPIRIFIQWNQLQSLLNPDGALKWALIKK
jgi:hypothetical protein